MSSPACQACFVTLCVCLSVHHVTPAHVTIPNTLPDIGPSRTITQNEIPRIPREQSKNKYPTSTQTTGIFTKSMPEEETSMNDATRSPNDEDLQGNGAAARKVVTKATKLLQKRNRKAYTSNKESSLMAVGDWKHAPADSALHDPYAWMKLNVSLHLEGDTIHVDWTFSTNDSRVTGFVVCYRVQDREEYDSSKLELRVRHFTIHSLHKDQIYEICVHVMVNSTVLREKCLEWSQNSMKMVVGIMAGTIFLIPLIILMIWILVKDRLIRKKYAYIFAKEFDGTDKDHHQHHSHGGDHQHHIEDHHQSRHHTSEGDHQHQQGGGDHEHHHHQRHHQHHHREGNHEHHHEHQHEQHQVTDQPPRLTRQPEPQQCGGGTTSSDATIEPDCHTAIVSKADMTSGQASPDHAKDLARSDSTAHTDGDPIDTDETLDKDPDRESIV